MKIITFNVNGIRARLPVVEQLIAQHQPDIIGIQETKIENIAFPDEMFQNLGYQVFKFGQKGHYGVALLVRLATTQSSYGLGDDGNDEQKRLQSITVDVGGQEITVYNAYFPQGEGRSNETKFKGKQQFYQRLTSHLAAPMKNNQHIVLMGDFNVAYNDIDIGIGEINQKRWLRDGKCCFLPEEREWLIALMDLGFTDGYRYLYPNKVEYSWYDYRSGGFEKQPKRGLRIDYQLLSESLLPFCKDSQILTYFRGGERPSDHCPVELLLDIN